MATGEERIIFLGGVVTIKLLLSTYTHAIKIKCSRLQKDMKIEREYFSKKKGFVGLETE